MRHIRRTLLASSAATLAAEIAGCSGQGNTDGNGDGTEAESTPMGEADESQASTVEVSADTALAAESYVHTFETTGTHEYFCVPHEAAGMVGMVVVE